MAAPSTVPAAPSRGKRVAVIGCGAAGLGAAYVLGQAGDVVTEIVLYEQREVLGGHANTVDVSCCSSCDRRVPVICGRAARGVAASCTESAVPPQCRLQLPSFGPSCKG